MVPQNPDYAARVKEIFLSAPFIQHLGIELVGCGPGWAETRLRVEERHFQQDAVIHAGVQATLADHTAGAAAGTLMAQSEIVLTVEYKVQLLRPARGDTLVCRAEVLRPGTRISAVEATVSASAGGAEPRAVAKLTATMTYLGGAGGA